MKGQLARCAVIVTNFEIVYFQLTLFDRGAKAHSVRGGPIRNIDLKGGSQRPRLALGVEEYLGHRPFEVDFGMIVLIQDDAFHRGSNRLTRVSAARFDNQVARRFLEDKISVIAVSRATIVFQPDFER